MIVTDHLPLRRVLHRLWLPVLLLFAYDVAVTSLYVGADQRWLGVDNLPLSLLGSALAIIVGLRNNTAYSRWWEARTLWGSAVNNSRSFARGVLATIGDGPDARSLIRLQLAWARALRAALWRQDTGPALADLPPAVAEHLATRTNLPAAVQMEMAREIHALAESGRLDSVRLAALDATLGRLADAQGGLERIRNTPMPRQFDQFQRVFVTAYCLSLPIGLVADLGTATPVGSTVIGIAFLALDQIGRDLQDPFNRSVHDVPMNAIVRTIETDLLQTIEAQPPPPARARNGVLA